DYEFYHNFTHQKSAAMRPLLSTLIQANDTTLCIPPEKMPLDMQNYIGQEGIFNHTYKRQGGGDIYSYIALRVQKTEDSSIRIQEALPDNLYDFLGGKDILPKTQSTEWLESFPYILQALVNECLNRKIRGIQFIILEIRFHPVDYRPLAYYICTQKLLEKTLLIS
ncbi:MAG: hypothetical protein ACOVQA_15015, partial [Thermoflexibacteraceae bacterium]